MPILNSRRRSFSGRFVLSALALAVLAANGAAAPSVPAARILPFSGDKTLVALSESGRYLAVMQGGQLGDVHFSGQTLKVWPANANFAVEKPVFNAADKTLASHLDWVGDTLLYGALRGATRQQWESDEVTDMYGKLRGLSWNAASRQLKPFEPALAECIVPDPTRNRVLAFDFAALMSTVQQRSARPVQKKSATLPPLTGVRGGLSTESYALSTGTLLARVGLPMRAPSIQGTSDFIPLTVANQGRILLAVTDFSRQWNRKDARNTNIQYLVALDLKTGAVKALTSGTDETDPDAMRTGREPHATRLPVLVGGGRYVACALDASERNRSYRFQYYDLTGKLAREVILDSRQCTRIGLPEEGEAMTWDAAGNAIIQTPNDVWFLDVKNATAQRLASDLYIENVLTRTQSGQILVRARKVGHKAGQKTTAEGTENLTYSDATYWVVLTPPKTEGSIFNSAVWTPDATLSPKQLPERLTSTIVRE